MSRSDRERLNSPHEEIGSSGMQNLSGGLKVTTLPLDCHMLAKCRWYLLLFSWYQRKNTRVQVYFIILKMISYWWQMNISSCCCRSMAMGWRQTLDWMWWRKRRIVSMWRGMRHLPTPTPAMKRTLAVRKICIFVLPVGFKNVQHV